MTERYRSPAIVLHWIIAIAIFLMLASGITMEYIQTSKEFHFQVAQWHKSLGVLTLLAVTLRILYRLGHRPPELPARFAGWERTAAELGHGGLYAVMLLMPLSGWFMVSSSSWGLPTVVFNWFEWPHIPGLAGNDLVNSLAKKTHYFTFLAILALLAAHIGAVVKHAMFDHENLLRRMWWGKNEKAPKV